MDWQFLIGSATACDAQWLLWLICTLEYKAIRAKIQAEMLQMTCLSCVIIVWVMEWLEIPSSMREQIIEVLVCLTPMIDEIALLKGHASDLDDR